MNNRSRARILKRDFIPFTQPAFYVALTTLVAIIAVATSLIATNSTYPQG